VRRRVPEEILLVVVCPECRVYCRDSAVFCSNCGIQLAVGPPYPREIVQRYGVIEKTIGELTQENKALREQLSRQNESMVQLKAEDMSYRSNIQREFSDKIRLQEEQLAKALSQVQALAAQIRADQQARRTETSRIDELVEATRGLVQQVRRLSVTRRYCDRCGRPLIATSDPNVLACPVCGVC
jgi:hypothetical protein